MFGKVGPLTAALCWRCLGGGVWTGFSPGADGRIKGVGALAASRLAGSCSQIKASTALSFRLMWKCQLRSKAELCFIHVRLAFTPPRFPRTAKSRGGGAELLCSAVVVAAGKMGI